MRTKPFSHSAVRSLIAAACALSCVAAEAATIKIQSRDPAGYGFDDKTPVAPVGGNMGKTLGEQRWNVYRHVADYWEKQLNSNVEITVSAGWEDLECDSTSAVLGSASAWNGWRNFPGSIPNTWYPQALANKIAGENLSAGQPDDGSGYGNVDIKTQFNTRLGEAGCLDNSPFYLGLDGDNGDKIDFAATLLHELGHGLGFSVYSTSTVSGARSSGSPSIWERFMYDNTAGKTWLQMTNAERVASAINPQQLAWNGPNVAAGAYMLDPLPVVKFASPAGALSTVAYARSTFGPPLRSSGTLGALATIATQDGESGPGCSPYNAANAAAAKGKVAIVSRGGCNFTQKVKNAQDAGAIAVLIANNATGVTVPGGADPNIRIPSAGISQADGNMLKLAVAAAKPYGSRTKEGTVTASLGLDAVRKIGADAMNRPLLYTPNPRVPGSSVSHWDTTASPNLLMEPNINDDLTLDVSPPRDLTLPLLKDLGW